MVRYSAILLLLLASLATEARSGQDAPAPSRKEFKQSKTYPYVFVPVGYLSNGGPLPLLFGPAASDCENRTPPAPPKAAKKKEKPASSPEEPGASGQATPAPSPAAPAPPTAPVPEPVVPPANPESPAYPPPDAQQAVPQGDSLDLNKYPAEVVNIFKNPYTVPKSRQHFFDPIFEPPTPQAPPPTPELPPSKATYRQQ